MPSPRRIFQLARASAHSACGWLAYRLGWQGTARRQFERVLLLRGADFRAYVHLAKIAFDHGDYAGWRRELEHARRTDPIRFARLRHPVELFEPRLAGTQFEGSHELDGFQAADSRATWRALHPFGADPFRHEDPRARDGRSSDGRSPDGFGRGTDLPLAPGYDPMSPGQQLDDRDPHDCDPDELHDRLLHGDSLGDGADRNGDNRNGDNRDGKNRDGSRSNRDRGNGSSTGRPDAANGDQSGNMSNDAFFGAGGSSYGSQPGWNAPDASMSRDDFSSPIERRRFQLRRPIDRQEIARCDLNELARRLSS